MRISFKFEVRPKIEMTSLQQGMLKGRKKGWCQCEWCGMGMSFNEKGICHDHIKNCPVITQVSDSDRKAILERTYGG